MISGEYAFIIYNCQALMKQTVHLMFSSIMNYLPCKHFNVSVKEVFFLLFHLKMYMLIAFYCVCSYVHRGSSRYDGTQRSGRGDGVLLQRGRDTLVLAGDTVVVHQEPRGLDGQTALDNQ